MAMEGGEGITEGCKSPLTTERSFGSIFVNSFGIYLFILRFVVPLSVCL